MSTLAKVADTRTVCLVKVDDDLGVVARSVDVVIDLVPISNVGKHIFSSVGQHAECYVRPASFGPGNLAKG